MGIYVTGQIELRTSDALTVPETALVFRDGISYLFKINENRRVTRMRVETGRHNDGSRDRVGHRPIRERREVRCRIPCGESAGQG